MHFESAQWKYLVPFSEYPCVVLERGEPWNDYGYVTRFTAYFFPREDEEVLLGTVKILQRGQKRTELPGAFYQLDDNFCCLGQSLEFYENVRKLGMPAAEEILRGLRDAVLTPALREQFRDDPAYHHSLLRASSALWALRSAGALFGHQAEAPSPLSFTYTTLLEGFDAPHQLELEFRAQDVWLGRIFALIGRNGTGKTLLLGRLAHALSGLTEEEATGLKPTRLPISQVIAISYSAFDTFTRPRHQLGVNYVYCGLRDSKDRVNLQWAMSTFGESLAEIQEQQRWPLWNRLLQDSGALEELHTPADVIQKSQRLSEWLQQQSSGHKLILLVVARLLAHIRVGSVLLFDEPETHLHPHLLSSLMRLLHVLLDEFDSYAIIATHSPIVLQELPARNVRLLEREGGMPNVRTYPGESFGENLTEIVNIAFGLNEKSKNYFRALSQLVERRRSSREAVTALFDRGLSLNARMALHALTTEREDKKNDEP